jgi:serine O-acetyltransferase
MSDLITDLQQTILSQRQTKIDVSPTDKRQKIDTFFANLQSALYVEDGKKQASSLQSALAWLVSEVGEVKAASCFSTIPNTQKLLNADIAAAYAGDPAANSVEEVIESFPSILTLLYHRIAHQLYLLGEKRLARLIGESAHSTTGIDIHPGATIGSGLFIDHGTGVVIGETAVVGDNVRIYQGVTLGAKSFRKDDTGAIVKGEPRHPIVEDNVIIYAHATILGRITIGRDSIIGGNVWVTSDVPNGTKVMQTRANREVFHGHGDGI